MVYGLRSFLKNRTCGRDNSRNGTPDFESLIWSFSWQKSLPDALFAVFNFCAGFLNKKQWVPDKKATSTQFTQEKTTLINVFPSMNQIKEIHCFLQHVVDICRKYRWEKSRTLRNLPKHVFWTVFGLVGVVFGWGTFYNWKVKLPNLVDPISWIIPVFQLHNGFNWPEP